MEVSTAAGVATGSSYCLNRHPVVATRSGGGLFPSHLRTLLIVYLPTDRLSIAFNHHIVRSALMAAITQARAVFGSQR